jgi:hypothetical protein
MHHFYQVPTEGVGRKINSRILSNVPNYLPPSPTICHWCLRKLDSLSLYQKSVRNPLQICLQVFFHFLFLNSKEFEGEVLLCICIHSFWSDGHPKKALPACSISLQAIYFLYQRLCGTQSDFYYTSFWHYLLFLQEVVESIWSDYFIEVTLKNRVCSHIYLELLP